MAAVMYAAWALKPVKISVWAAGWLTSPTSVDTNPLRNGCIMWASVAQPDTGTRTRIHCAQREHASPPRPSPPAAQPPFSLSAAVLAAAFSVIGRLIGGEISRLMAELEWWISSVSSIGSTTLPPGSISAWVVCFQPSSSLVLKA